MTLVIETNMTINDEHNFQSRIIEVESWDVYVEEIKNKKSVHRNAYIGNCYGNSLPRVSKVENFVNDECHLSCDVEMYNGVTFKKLAYLIR